MGGDHKWWMGISGVGYIDTLGSLGYNIRCILYSDIVRLQPTSVGCGVGEPEAYTCSTHEEGQMSENVER
jgi:hypothetical protein